MKQPKRSNAKEELNLHACVGSRGVADHKGIIAVDGWHDRRSALRARRHERAAVRVARSCVHNGVLGGNVVPGVVRI
jgi:hypothetical protein